MSHYHINIFWSEEDGAFVADAPDLESCSALGSTPEGALRELKRAMRAWMAAAKRAKRPVPPARYRPAIYQAG
ncbi:MAG: type II toxin-antitoxin system HicB family antitoxin [Planctomycetaceae bacterium]|nr:type II toxin-antitoxin system HicB family antitoxin [Planctomycetota bacterium]NUN51857.1 type II toxin-antitoxin system HicB family antitoxin [Planctomycetaceae bacterium]